MQELRRLSWKRRQHKGELFGDRRKLVFLRTETNTQKNKTWRREKHIAPKLSVGQFPLPPPFFSFLFFSFPFTHLLKSSGTNTLTASSNFNPASPSNPPLASSCAPSTSISPHLPMSFPAAAAVADLR